MTAIAAYRYRLERHWCEGRGLCAFVMLNPSTADEHRDDPTIRRCIGFARHWGYAGLIVANLFARRATDPLTLFAAHDPVGDPANRDAILGAIDEAALILCAWGHFPAAADRGRQAIALVHQRGGTPYCLGLTKRGAPRHPLYVPATTRPMILSHLG
jgi:hypothetical protein